MRYPRRYTPERFTLTERQLSWLLNQLCVGLGICDPSYDTVKALLPADSETLADAVLRAEGLTPELVERALRRTVRELIETAAAREE